MGELNGPAGREQRLALAVVDDISLETGSMELGTEWARNGSDQGRRIGTGVGVIDHKPQVRRHFTKTPRTADTPRR